jgi:hypothetical protein
LTIVQRLQGHLPAGDDPNDVGRVYAPALRAVALRGLGKPEDAKRVFEEVNERYRGSKGLLQQLARAGLLFDEATYRNAKGDRSGALDLLAEVDRDYGHAQMAQVKLLAATARLTRGRILFADGATRDQGLMSWRSSRPMNCYTKASRCGALRRPRHSTAGLPSERSQV